MSGVLPSGLTEFHNKFRDLVEDIQDANLVGKPLCPCREPEIQAAINHPFSTWLDHHASFQSARKKIEAEPYYLGVHDEYRRRWWVELKYKLAVALVIYFEYRKPQIIEGIKAGSIRVPLLNYGRKAKKTKKEKIAELANELLSEIRGCYVLPTITKNCQLESLLTELASSIESGKTSKLGLSKLHEHVAREAMIKMLVTPSVIFTGNAYNAIILDLVSIVDPTVDRDTIDRFVAEMRPELEVERREMIAEAAKLEGTNAPLGTDICRFCGLPITCGSLL